jgi:hypothetical protein
MPWSEIRPMDERLQSVTDHQRGLYAMTGRIDEATMRVYG